MKTGTVNGANVTMLKARGHGDGGAVVRYFIEEADGTYSEIGEWYSDPSMAAKVYDAPDAPHLAWVVKEARRQTVEPDKRDAQEPRPTPEAMTTAAVR